LDVSIQAQVVNLLQDLQEEHKLTYLFIAHDLSMVKHISDRIGVMHNGKLLEVGTSDEIYHYGVIRILKVFYQRFRCQILTMSVNANGSNTSANQTITKNEQWKRSHQDISFMPRKKKPRSIKKS